MRSKFSGWNADERDMLQPRQAQSRSGSFGVNVALDVRLLIILSVAILIGAFFVSDGLFTLDELIYLAGAQAMADGQIAIANGYEQYGSDALRMWLLVEGPHGLVPQYPPGPSLLGALFVETLGARGFIIANAVGVSATLFLILALGRRLYPSTSVGFVAGLLFLFGSFTLEYAYGVWPHGIALAFVTATVLLTVYALDA